MKHWKLTIGREKKQHLLQENGIQLMGLSHYTQILQGIEILLVDLRLYPQTPQGVIIPLLEIFQT